MDRIGRERGWPPTTRAAYEAGHELEGHTFTGSAAGNTQVICAEDGVEGAADVAISAQGLPAPRRVQGRVMP